MALTLVEGAKLSNDLLLSGVIETIVKESPVLQSLPFIEVVGNGLTYNQENTAPTAAFYTVGDAWAESTPTFTQVTASLKVLGGDADVDKLPQVDPLQHPGPRGRRRPAQGQGRPRQVRGHLHQRRHVLRHQVLRRRRQARRPPPSPSPWARTAQPSPSTS